MINPQPTNLVNQLDDLYQDSSLYSTPEMFSPPSERRPHVIRFELMTGCSWQNCTYCEGYRGVPFRNKTLDEYVHHVDAVWEKIGSYTELAKGLQRIFIGGGDALGVKTKTLREAVRYTWMEFHKHTGNLPRRISVYGGTQSILKQGAENLKALKVDSGLDLVYWGVESGSTEVLKYVRKGCTQEDLLKAADYIHSAEMPTSIMIMPGLGGIKYYEQHVTETAKVIDAI
ncbi:MAG: radical SAM protein, partial [Nanoarchaeota archaeon]